MEYGIEKIMFLASSLSNDEIEEALSNGYRFEYTFVLMIKNKFNKSDLIYNIDINEIEYAKYIIDIICRLEAFIDLKNYNNLEVEILKDEIMLLPLGEGDHLSRNQLFRVFSLIPATSKTLHEFEKVKASDVARIVGIKHTLEIAIVLKKYGIHLLRE